MYEFGIILTPADVLDVIAANNPGYLPLDYKRKIRGYHLDSRGNALVIDFETDEDLGKQPIPIKDSDGHPKVG